MIKLQIIGNLGRDGVVREVNGKNVINFSVAHTERFRDAAGNQKERTTWVDCSYWSDRTAVAPYLKKGTMVFAEGIPSAEAFTAKDGTQGVALRMRVMNVQLLGTSRPDGSSPTAAGETAIAGYTSSSGAGDIGDDLPF